MWRWLTTLAGGFAALRGAPSWGGPGGIGAPGDDILEMPSKKFGAGASVAGWVVRGDAHRVAKQREELREPAVNLLRRAVLVQTPPSSGWRHHLRHGSSLPCCMIC